MSVQVECGGFNLHVKDQLHWNQKEEETEEKEGGRVSEMIDHSNVDTSARDKNERSTFDNNNSDKLDDQHPPQCELVLRSYHSILKNSVSYKERDRVDQHGQQILSIAKDHKICFSEQLFDITIVENWKEYNSIDEEEAGEEKCNCWLI